MNRLAVLIAALTAGSGTLAAPPVQTQVPTGGLVVAGAATVSQSGNALNIVQSTDKAIINWQTFSIGSQSQVAFTQPGSQSAALNRVLSGEPSAIYGQLSANGHIYLINTNGIVVGPGGQITAGGLTLSTSALTDADFLSGTNHFSPQPGSGGISVDGSIAVDGPLEFHAASFTLGSSGSIASDSGEVVIDTSGGIPVLPGGGGISVPETETIPTMTTTPITSISRGGDIVLASSAQLRNGWPVAGSISGGSISLGSPVPTITAAGSVSIGPITAVSSVTGRGNASQPGGSTQANVSVSGQSAGPLVDGAMTIRFNLVAGPAL